MQGIFRRTRGHKGKEEYMGVQGYQKSTGGYMGDNKGE